jgi:hypothetical protein
MLKVKYFCNGFFLAAIILGFLFTSLQAETNFQNIDWTQYLGGKFSFIIKNIGIPDLIYSRRYSANEKEDDIVLMYRGSGVDMRMYVWDQKVYRMYFSMEHQFNIFHGVRSGMSKEQIESLLGPVGKVTDKNLHLWKSGNVKLVVDFNKEGKAKEILLSLDEN